MNMGGKLPLGYKIIDNRFVTIYLVTSNKKLKLTISRNQLPISIPESRKP